MRILIKYFLIFTSFTFYSQNFEYVDLFDNSMNSEVFCYRIPSLVTTTNGTLIAAIDERNNSCGDLNCLLYTSPSPRDRTRSRMPSSA